MEIHVYKDAETIGTAAATLFAAHILENPSCVLGLATGSTPLPTYRKLVEFHRSGVLDFSRVTTFNLDEYIGLTHEHPQSYYYFMQENLFSHININQERIHVPSGTGKPEENCRAYEKSIVQAGGIDLQILGIGRNGHLADNAPADHCPAMTHTGELTESTIEANKRFFDKAEDVPRQAISMGIGSIMHARAILLIATGADKADAVYSMVHGEVSPQCPASVLQLHPNAVILLDEAAAARL